MKKPMKRETLIKNLNKRFGLSAVDASKFYGRESENIWINDDICTEKTNYYPYADGTLDDNKLNTYLQSKGWYAEPHDSETIMICVGYF